MAGLFSRLKTWITNEDITADDLNGEFDNIIDNLAPNLVGPYSTTQAKLQETFDVGAVGSENLPTTLMEELQAERNMIKKITGQPQWYSEPPITLNVLASILTSTATPPNRIISGTEDAQGQPHFLKCNGTDFVLTLDAAPTVLSYYVNNILLTQASDLTISLASNVGPGAVAGAATASDPNNLTLEESKYLGEDSSVIWLGPTVGASLAAQVNLPCAFKTTNGGDTEIFLGTLRLNGVNYYINDCKRGWFFNGTQVNQRVILGVAQAIELLSISYVFIKNDGTLQKNTTNRPPYTGGKLPVGAIPNDYWFDTDDGTWKLFDGLNWNDSLSTFLGMSCQDATTCFGVRSVDFFKTYSDLNELSLKVNPLLTEIQGRNISASVSIYGRGGVFSPGFPKWVSGDLDTGVWSAGFNYYLYLTKDFTPKFSLIAPQERPELGGHYHLSYPWRCIAKTYTDLATPTFSIIRPIINFGKLASQTPASLDVSKLKPYVLSSLVAGKVEFNQWNRCVISVGLVTNPGGTTTVDTTGIPLLCSGRPIMAIGCSESVIGIVADNLKISVLIQINDESTATWSTLRTFVIADPWTAVPGSLSRATVGNFSTIVGMDGSTQALSGLKNFRVRYQIDDSSGADYAAYQLAMSVFFFEM